MSTTPEDALKFAQKYLGKTAYDNWCERFYANSYGRAHSGFGSARQAYRAGVANRSIQQGSAPPVGAAVYFRGNKDYGHVAISAGGGYVISSGIGGKVQRVKIADMPRIFGKTSGQYLGWQDSKVAFKGAGGKFSAHTPLSANAREDRAPSASGAAASTMPGGQAISSSGIAPMARQFSDITADTQVKTPQASAPRIF